MIYLYWQTKRDNDREFQIQQFIRAFLMFLLKMTTIRLFQFIQIWRQRYSWNKFYSTNVCVAAWIDMIEFTDKECVFHNFAGKWSQLSNLAVLDKMDEEVFFEMSDALFVIIRFLVLMEDYFSPIRWWIMCRISLICFR